MTANQDDYLRLTIISEKGSGETFHGQTMHFVESAIVDDLRRQLTDANDHVTHLKKACSDWEMANATTEALMLSHEGMIETLTQQLATAHAFVEACSNRVSYGGEYDDVRGDYNIHVAFCDRREAMVARDKLEQLLRGTAGRDMLDEMRRKDERIAELEKYEAELSAVRDLVQKKHHMGGVMHVGMLCVAKAVEDLIADMPDAEVPSVDEDQEPNSEPACEQCNDTGFRFGEEQYPNGSYIEVECECKKPKLVEWQYRRHDNGLIWRTSDGVKVQIRDANEWFPFSGFPTWQACCDDPSTYPCNEHGERIEDHGKMVTTCAGQQSEIAELRQQLAAQAELIRAHEPMRENTILDLTQVVKQRDEATKQLAAQAPLVKIAEALRFLLKDAEIDARSYTVLIVPGEERARLQDIQKQTASALAKLRDTKGGA